MTHRIEIKDLFNESAFERFPGWRDLWVDIRPFQGHAAVQRLDAARSPSMVMRAGDFDKMMSDRAASTDDAATQAVTADAPISVPFGGDTGEFTAVLFETSIVAWNLTDSQGKALPIGRAGAQHPELQRNLGDAIVDAISEYYVSQELSEADLKG